MYSTHMQFKISVLGWICLSIVLFMLLTALLAWLYCLWQGCCADPNIHPSAAPDDTRHNKEPSPDAEAEDFADVFTVDDDTHWSILSSPPQVVPLLEPVTAAPQGAHNTLTRPKSPQDASIQRYLRLEVQEQAFRTRMIVARIAQQSSVHPRADARPVHQVWNTHDVTETSMRTAPQGSSYPYVATSGKLNNQSLNNCLPDRVEHSQHGSAMLSPQAMHLRCSQLRWTRCRKV